MDLNTFSNNGNEDNIGLAGLLKLNNKRKLTEKWSLENDFSIEMLQKTSIELSDLGQLNLKEIGTS